MKNIVWFFLFSISCIGLSAQESVKMPAADQLLEDLVTEKKIVGVAAGYMRAGQVVWTGGKGYRNVKAKQAFTDTTLTRIASIAKPMTAIAIMQLVEQGQIDLDAPIQNLSSRFSQSWLFVYQRQTIIVAYLRNQRL